MQCTESDAVNVGDGEVTCHGGTFFLFQLHPHCLQPGETFCMLSNFKTIFKEPALLNTLILEDAGIEIKQSKLN